MSGPQIDRRAAMAWAGALAAALGAGYYHGISFSDPAKAKPGPGYGLDPNMIDPVTPWPRVMTEAQRATVKAFVDHILPREGAAPSASDVGVDQLIDEWVSAPYPEMQADNALILAGLAHLDAQARRLGGSAFATAAPAIRAKVVERIADPGTNIPPKGFYARLRRLTIGGYYTTEAGMTDIGYIGNKPLKEFPAPTPEVLAALDRAYATLGLNQPSNAG